MTLLIIPIVAALVGWITNIIAIKMTFYPLEFFGFELVQDVVKSVGFKASFRRLGWQGIIPSKAGIIAGKSVDLLTTQLINIEEEFEKLDPQIVMKEMEPSIERLTRVVTNDIMEEQIPLMWKVLPKRRKDKIYEDASREFPHVVEEIMAEIKAHIKELFDVRTMAIEALTSNKALLNELFLKCGKNEFKFIERSGIYFGFLFGLVQMAVWYVYPAWWILPLGGFLVGYMTNWLALKMIFEPIKPMKVGFWTVQGLFIKRQKEVAEEYAEIVTDNILTTSNIFNALIEGDGADKLMDIVQKHVQHGVDKTAGLNRSLIQITSGTKRYEEIKEIACRRFIDEMPDTVKEAFDYAEEALDIKNTLRSKMTALSPQKFVGVLRPAFQEDEWKLILTGTALGLVAGLIQLVFLL